MPHYNIKFEIYGKKMQTTIEAESMAEAEKKLRDKIIIHENKRVDYGHDDIMDFLNMFKK
jgi:predicted SnoaL-like aldol condensation-catalyzing enzyme